MRREQKPWGIVGDVGAAKRNIEITMSDTMRFSPSTINVKQGEVVRFDQAGMVGKIRVSPR